ncbi:hypothetical protein MNEG_9975 [Monoraphidium neglectum]|uniref:Uncharacterized protein n=1 Tax=Monoraphidium neglectum TaxID=145388 RepID=A0A0D2MU75_9CHLO|nr:hypothetical protein MNEG_9975 [Monoraphidium neglectum]KIY97985.1 hypothetical protein MNEG_9975 [Monoraphidium neglectum]|eukprot:XP_013897005.1 hypothetical protein MNEG_9975 [Monoraphidium neglectum]
MLDMLRDHSNNHHNEKLELIVIVLLIVGVCVALLELAGLLGWAFSPLPLLLPESAP